MPTKNKCCCKVSINNTNKTRSCKANVFGNFGGKNFCYIHSQKMLFNKATYIQKIQRGKRCRQVVEKIYKNVPSEIQYIIDGYISQEIYIKKATRKFLDILSNKFNKITSKLSQIVSSEYNEINNEFYIDVIKKILNVYSICFKNWKVISETTLFTIQTNLMRLFIWGRYQVWGITIWNGIPGSGLFNYLEYYGDFLSQYQELTDKLYYFIKKYHDLFNFTFKYFRINTHEAFIENKLNTQPDSHDQILLNIELLNILD